MSFISDLKTMFGLTRESRDEIKRELDFYQAIDVHLAWKRRLSDYLAGRGKEVLEPHNICVDNRCALGQWIHGAGKARFGEFELFKQLTEEHAKFHFYAAKVVEEHQTGHSTAAEKILMDDFARQSNKTITCITKLHAQIEGQND
ncbi:MAG: CZB domain-containing protein [Sideroxydans sp.]|nr:CZB domain-containing protein [Sideroxydans sp.]